MFSKWFHVVHACVGVRIGMGRRIVGILCPRPRFASTCPLSSRAATTCSSASRRQPWERRGKWAVSLPRLWQSTSTFFFRLLSLLLHPPYDTWFHVVAVSWRCHVAHVILCSFMIWQCKVTCRHVTSCYDSIRHLRDRYQTPRIITWMICGSKFRGCNLYQGRTCRKIRKQCKQGGAVLVIRLVFNVARSVSFVHFLFFYNTLLSIHGRIWCNMLFPPLPHCLQHDQVVLLDFSCGTLD